MRIADFSGNSAQLGESFDSMKAAWSEAAVRWDDATSRRFYKERLEPLEQSTRRAIGAMQRLAELFARAERECSDR
jgi:hypothetical protein